MSTRIERNNNDSLCNCYEQWAQSCSETVTKVRDHAAPFFYLAARVCVSPLWTTTGLWLHTISLYNDPECSTFQKILSITASTLLSVALLPFALSGLAVGQIFHSAAYYLATTPYIHLKGQSQGPSDDQSLSVFQLNCCLTAGDFALLFGGLPKSDMERADAIGDIILENKPKVVGLQEVSDLLPAFKLYQKLSAEYEDFYFHMGATPWVLQNNSGLFVASKNPISQPEFQSFSDIKGTETMVNKGFFSFQVKEDLFINTHCSPSSDDSAPTPAEIQTRREEQTRILEVVNKNIKRTFVMGDFNTNEGPLFETGLPQRKLPGASCTTDSLVARNWRHDQTTEYPELFVDYFLPFACPSTVTTKVIQTSNLNNPTAAISDHPGLFSTIEDLV